ncbi:D-beta-hydroxybutyrate dehydrogenase, mitochondrial-like isoform X2 [Penaeus chinensis]|uniref:D-beta-hydroxybutyrate dehydrogenase, mitochondrial-like isoform X2 n=1 Tax=Penaeus chinensis TaxID=139456 RepID=UPI001FB6988A|nr:D-beta-hydroxybutyrate dehydrogenase, mitochondrial-like isoform X2 [Penaeus chinensis]
MMLLTLDTTAEMLLWGCAGSVLAVGLSFLDLSEAPFCLLHLLLAGWALAAAGCLARACLKVPVHRRAVLVTGCDSGFGHQLAQHLDRIGFRVFAGCLHANSQGEGAETLRKLGSAKLHVMQLDVTKQEELKEAKKHVQALMQKGEVLWGLVNNAGIGCLGLTEMTTIAKYKQIANVNIFGMVACTQTFLPLIKQSKGRIVNVGSMVGRVPQPILTPYVVTKYAVEGFSDCLRVELKPRQVKVSVIEPGNFAKATGIAGEERLRRQEEDLWGALDEDLRREHPRQALRAVTQALRAFRDAGPDSMTPVLEAMTDALTQRFPRARYMPMDLHTFVRIFVATHFPEWLYDLLYVSHSL